MKIYDTVPVGYVLTKSGLESTSTLKPDRKMPSDIEVNKCQEWIRLFAKPQKNINIKAYSYGLKHRVENWAHIYVSNGDFIRAALLEGYKFSQDFTENMLFKNNGLDAFFNMKLLPEENWQRIKPSGFSKWLLHRVNENSQLGYLAQDAASDPTWPRTSKRFYDFWIRLRHPGISKDVMEVFLDAWEEYSGRKPPFPDDDILLNCEAFYSDECDIVHYNESYPTAPANHTYIYVLFEDSSQRKVKYVGQTSTPSQRLKQHVLNPGNLEKLAWIGKLVNEGKFPCMGIIDTVLSFDANRAEQTYIYAFADFERDTEQDIKDIFLNKSLI